MMIPGVQKPHCDPPVAQNAAASPSRTAGSSPSIVTTDRPATRPTGVTHATRGSPSTSTVQQPHCPWGAQPSFSERRPSRSRSTDNSDSSADASTATMRPLHVKLVSILGGIDQEKDWPQPQVRCALGLLIVNPASCRPSL